MKTFRCRDANWFSFAASAVFVLLILSSAAHASNVRDLWQSRDQFVALERQESVSSGHALLNDHPLVLTLDRLTAILASIELRATEDGKPESLFSNPALQVLAPQLQQGLEQASPGEDVTFAIIGLHDTLYGLAKSPKVTTGRVFYKSGRLNIIFGLIRQEVRERDDRRLSPFTPGSRQKASEGVWTLLPQPATNGFTLVRKDWVNFSDDWLAPVTEQTVQTKLAQPMDLMKDKRTPAERLIILNELKYKGLISEEEYRGKRLEILNGL